MIEHFCVYFAVTEETEGKENPVTLPLTSKKEYGKVSFTEKKKLKPTIPTALLTAMLACELKVRYSSWNETSSVQLHLAKRTTKKKIVKTLRSLRKIMEDYFFRFNP